MKNGGTCPKCGGRDAVPVPAADGFLPRADVGALPVERYLCLGCGYLESWVDLEAFERMGGRESWEKQLRAEESDRRFGADLAYYSGKARREREQPPKPPEETKRKWREDPWT